MIFFHSVYCFCLFASFNLKILSGKSTTAAYTPLSSLNAFSRVGGNLTRGNLKTSTPCSSSGGSSLSKTSALIEQNRFVQKSKKIKSNATNVNKRTISSADKQTATSDIQTTKEIEALGVLIQHLVFNVSLCFV